MYVLFALSSNVSNGINKYFLFSLYQLIIFSCCSILIGILFLDFLFIHFIKAKPHLSCLDELQRPQHGIQLTILILLFD